MHRIPQKLRERAISMFAVAMNIGCSIRAIRHLRQRFQATGRTKDRPLSGRPLVTTRGQDQYLSHNKHYFQCNIAITNFLVSNTCEIRFREVMGQSTVPMYSYAKNPKTWLTYMAKLVCFGTLFFNLIRLIQLCDKRI